MRNNLFKLWAFVIVFVFDPFTLAMLASLAGTAISGINQQKAASKRKKATQAMLDDASRFDEESRNRLSDSLAEFDPEQRKTRVLDREESNLGGITESLLRDRDETLGETGGGFRGNISEDFKAESADRTESRLQNSIDLAKRAAKFITPGQQAQDEGSILRTLGGDLGTIRTNARGQRGANQAKIASIRPGAGAEIFASVLKGLGLAGGLASAGGAGTGGAISRAGATGVSGGQTALLPPIRTSFAGGLF